MSKKIIALLISVVLSLLDTRMLFAQAIPGPDELVTKNPIQPLPETEEKHDKESDIRRAEIIFLISLPFTAILSLLVVNGAYLISNPSHGFTTAGLPSEIWPFTIFSAVFTSGAITYYDYTTVHQKDKDHPGQIQLGVNFEKKF